MCGWSVATALYSDVGEGAGSAERRWQLEYQQGGINKRGWLFFSHPRSCYVV